SVPRRQAPSTRLSSDAGGGTRGALPGIRGPSDAGEGTRGPLPLALPAQPVNAGAVARAPLTARFLCFLWCLRFLCTAFTAPVVGAVAPEVGAVPLVGEVLLVVGGVVE